MASSEPRPVGPLRRNARKTTRGRTYSLRPAGLSDSLSRNGSVLRSDTLTSRESGAATTGYRMG